MKRTFKIEGKFILPFANDWTEERIEQEFKTMLKEEAGLEFDGTIEEVYE